MKRKIFAALCLALALNAQAGADLDTQLVTQGSAAVTVGDVDAMMQRLTSDQQIETIGNPKRVDQMVIGILRDKQLAAQAVEAKLDQDPKVKAQITLATAEILSRARMDAFENSLKLPNMEPLAREEYAVHKKDYAVAAEVEVQHVLIAEKGRTDAEAKALANKVQADAQSNPGGFDRLVSQYSDDTTKVSNLGHVRGATSAKVAPEFAAAAARLKTNGEISPVVHTKFGYHVLKLLNATPAHQFTFAEAKGKIEAQLRERYISEQRKAFIGKLDTAAPTVNPKIMDILRERYVPAGLVTPTEAAHSKNP